VLGAGGAAGALALSVLLGFLRRRRRAAPAADVEAVVIPLPRSTARVEERRAA
jgi:hypothetical protein